MKIDVHGHLSAPDSLYAYKANLLAHRGAHGRGGAGITDDTLRAALTEPNKTFGGLSHLQHLDQAGVDIQLISPRPYQMMHSEQARLVEWFTEETNDATGRTCQIEHGRFRGIAGMPQSMETTPEHWTKELRRCVTELGFVGAMLNTDPCEGTAQPPALSERFWYPVWEAASELDVPVLIHSAGCRPPARESTNLPSRAGTPGHWESGELNRVIHPYWQASRTAIVSLMTRGCESTLTPAGAAWELLPSLNVTKPNAARVYDCLLGGKVNFEADLRHPSRD